MAHSRSRVVDARVVCMASGGTRLIADRQSTVGRESADEVRLQGTASIGGTELDCFDSDLESRTLDPEKNVATPFAEVATGSLSVQFVISNNPKRLLEIASPNDDQLFWIDILAERLFDLLDR